MEQHPVPGFGVNYWPAYAGPFMWRDFRGDQIEEDLRALSSEGVSYIRAFLLWPDFMPSRDGVEPAMLERLDAFVRIVEGIGLRLHLTLLVGHMSGDNWSPPWLPDPSRVYDDPGLVQIQERFVREMVGRVKGSPCLEAYVLTNEIPHFAGSASPAIVEPWARGLYDAIKEEDPSRPVSLGDGASYVVGGRTGFEPGQAQDVIAPHLYLSDTNGERLLAGFGLAIGVAAASGREAWLEEFGAPHSVFGDEEIAEWAERVVLEVRLQGATRVGWWCGFDFDHGLGSRAPYSHHPFELTFGMLRADRTPKPVAGALRRGMSGDLPRLEDAGLVVPEALVGRTSFAPREDDLTTRALRNAYVALRRIGYRPRPILERQVAEGGGPDLLVVPAARILEAGTWDALQRRSGRVLLSYLHGFQGFHGAWLHRAKDLFGGTPRNRFGVPGPAPRRLEAEGLSLEMPQAGDPFVGTPLVLDPSVAEVVGRDEGGRPMWVRMGGRDMLLYPLEALAEDPGPVEAFYRAALALRVTPTGSDGPRP